MFLLNSILYTFNLFLLHFPVFPDLALAFQPDMKLIQIKNVGYCFAEFVSPFYGLLRKEPLKLFKSCLFYKASLPFIQFFGIILRSDPCIQLLTWQLLLLLAEGCYFLFSVLLVFLLTSSQACCF